MKSKAFTMAEVLITLGVIGIVVAMTIPSMISGYKKAVIASKIRHVYAVLKNAESMAISQHGDMRNWDFIAPYSEFPAHNSSVVSKYYYPYLKTVPCEYDAYIKSSTGVNFIKIDKNVNYRCLPDGTMIYGYTLEQGYYGTNLFVDFNGDKAPNIVGIDVFIFFINRPVYKSEDYNTSTYRVVPKCPVGVSTCFQGPSHGSEGFYWEGDEETLIQYCISSTNDVYTINSNGNSCAYMIERAGWKVPKNYPLKI